MIDTILIWVLVIGMSFIFGICLAEIVHFIEQLMKRIKITKGYYPEGMIALFTFRIEIRTVKRWWHLTYHSPKEK